MTTKKKNSKRTRIEVLDKNFSPLTGDGEIHSGNVRVPAILKSAASDFLPDYPYLPRVSFKGRAYLQCPSCGLITTNKLVPGQFQLECYDQYNECKHRLYGFGLRLFPITRGRRANPTDHATVAGLREAFPVGEMFRWRSGEMAHQLVPGGRELARELVRQVRSKAAGGLYGLGAAFEQVVGEWGLELELE